jgi:hypothetical protein
MGRGFHVRMPLRPACCLAVGFGTWLLLWLLLGFSRPSQAQQSSPSKSLPIVGSQQTTLNAPSPLPIEDDLPNASHMASPSLLPGVSPSSQAPESLASSPPQPQNPLATPQTPPPPPPEKPLSKASETYLKPYEVIILSEPDPKPDPRKKATLQMWGENKVKVFSQGAKSTQTLTTRDGVQIRLEVAKPPPP